MPPKTSPAIVGFLLDAYVSHGRGIYEGLLAYASANALWDLKPVDPTRPLRNVPEGLVVGSLWGKPLSDLRAHGARCMIDVRSAWENEADIPAIKIDDVAVGVLAAETLLAQGYRHFVFAGLPGLRFSHRRQQGFRERLSRENPAIRLREWYSKGPGSVAEEAGPWLEKLPPRTAIFAANDQRAVRLARAALAAGRAVPDDVGILGVDNDPLEQQRGPLPLSSVQPDFHRIGWLAGQCLHSLLRGQPPGAMETLVPPSGVVFRSSCNPRHTRDKHIESALAFIRKRGGKRIGVDDVVRASGISRRPLERRFAEREGSTILACIHRECLHEATRLLRETPWSVQRVSEACGFDDVKYFSRLFRKDFGRTPSDFRKQASLGPPP